MSECNSIDNTILIYYQKNRDVILNRAKYYYENDKERLRKQARDKYRNLSEEEKYKKKRIWKKTDISICLKKRKKTKRISKKTIVKQKNLNIIINKIVFLILI